MLSIAYNLLAEIGSQEVTSYMSRILKDLVEGELLQMSGKVEEEDSLDLYEHKCYLKTASLIANGCRSIAALSERELVKDAGIFGTEVGIAFQIVDDVLDFVATPEELGKPGGGADMISGLRTAPLILAARKSERLRRLLEEKSRDKEEILSIVLNEGGVEEAQRMAVKHADIALDAIANWKDSPSKRDLKEILKIIHYDLYSETTSIRENTACIHFTVTKITEMNISVV